MKPWKKLIAFLLFVSLLPLSLTSCVLEEFIPDIFLPDESDSYAEAHDTVVVSVLDGANYTVTSQNPVRVGRGQAATFNIDLDTGFEYVSSVDGATYENGMLTIRDVTRPISVKLTLKRGDIVIPPGHNWSLNIQHDETSHWYSCNDKGCTEKLHLSPHEGGIATYYDKAVCDACGVAYGELIPIPEFETVTIAANEPEEGYRFLCWSIDIPVEEGGEVFSEEAAGTFDIPFESTPVANYVDVNHHVVLYRCNGGTTADGKDFLYHTFSNKHYAMPNAIHQNGTFVREGYTLARYTENPNGSGEYYTLGGKVPVGPTGFAELYLLWHLNTATGLEYSIKTDGERQYASVIGYFGSRFDVVIPASVDIRMGDGAIQSFPVEHISSYAFQRSSVISVTLPHTIKTIEPNAFSYCASLKTLTIHDTVMTVSDASFTDCPIEQIYLNAARGPFQAGGEGSFAKKYERLRLASARGDKKILVMSGSSSLYGLLAEEMEPAFNGEYTVINYGTNAGACSFVYLYAFSRFMGEGDIVIHAPETTSPTQMGQTKISAYTFRGSECIFDIFSYLDMTKFTGFFDALSEFNTKIRTKDGVLLPERSYEDGSSFLNEYCDLKNNPDNPDYKKQSENGMNIYSLATITEERTSNMNLINSMMNARGATMYYSFAPVCATAIHTNSSTKAARDAFVEKMQSMIDYKIISDPYNYILAENLFNNSDYHPGRTGASIRTAQLVMDIKAALAEEAKGGQQ